MDVGDLEVLLAVRLCSPGALRDLADRTGGTERELHRRVVALEGDGLLLRRRGGPAAWSLTRAGRLHGETLLGREVDRRGVRAELESGHLRFAELNGEVLAVCTRWQVREVDGRPVANDHSDPDRDREVVDELVELHERSRDLVRSLAGAAPWFAAFPARLEGAVRRVSAGEVEWFTRPTIGSFHTVWFELHETLLATLGRSRAAEKDHLVRTAPDVAMEER